MRCRRRRCTKTTGIGPSPRSARCITTIPRAAVVVVGLYHHRGRHSLEDGEYEGYVRRYGFDFPVAVDVNWSTLERWWIRGHHRAFTSVSFLLDRHGRVRGVHPGPKFTVGDPQYLAIRSAVETLLAEP